MCSETICSIDGKLAYGTYGRIPIHEVASLIFERNGKNIPLDVSAMYNPNVNNSNIKKYVQVTPWHDDSYKVTGYFSHDDGDDDMYICLWLATPSGSFRNYLGDYSALATLLEQVQKDSKNH